jgi:hypothetical protein
MKRKVMKMSDSDMASKLIAVIVEQRNQIVELESQITRLNQAGVEEMSVQLSAELIVELLTPEVVDGWKRVATAQLENYRERIVIPTTLLLAMINKIQANEAKNEHG